MPHAGNLENSHGPYNGLPPPSGKPGKAQQARQTLQTGDFAITALHRRPATCYDPPRFRSKRNSRNKRLVQVVVRENNVDQALKALKKKMQREGIFREMKMRRHYEKPSEKRAREKAEAIRRARKLARKRSSREE
jgi:ribosomal protein S21